MGVSKDTIGKVGRRRGALIVAKRSACLIYPAVLSTALRLAPESHSKYSPVIPSNS